MHMYICLTSWLRFLRAGGLAQAFDEDTHELSQAPRVTVHMLHDGDLANQLPKLEHLDSQTLFLESMSSKN